MVEVGCGDGALTRRLLEVGYDACGVDPDAPAGEPFVRATLEEYRSAELFDAAVAVRSMHHLHDLDRAIESLCALLRPSSRLVLFEFAVEHLDHAQAWLARQGLAYELDPAERAEVIPLAELRAALDPRLRLIDEKPAGYLAAELGRPDLVAAEEEAIVTGELRPVGARLVFEMPPG